MNKPLYESYLQAKADKKASYARDLASYLNVSEAELTHARVGHDANAYAMMYKLLKAINKVGEVKAITRNDIAVHEHLGEYTNARFSDHAGLILNPRAMDLRFSLLIGQAFFALTEERHQKGRVIAFNSLICMVMHYIKSMRQITRIWMNGMHLFNHSYWKKPILDITPVEPYSNTPVSNELAEQLNNNGVQ